jgi:outer membrane lipoprotein SlyB
MRTLAVVLSTLAIVGLCGCAGAYVAGDVGAGSSAQDARSTSR